MDLIVNVNLPGWGIGRDGQLLCRISADLKRFARLTTGQVVIYGRKTLATFPGGRPLKNRENWILSTDTGLTVEGARVFHAVPDLLAACREAEGRQLWVIGGASVYSALLPYCTTACLTRTFVQAEADTFFPDLDALPGWFCVEESEIFEENGLRYQYADYRQAAPLPMP